MVRFHRLGWGRARAQNAGKINDLFFLKKSPLEFHAALGRGRIERTKPRARWARGFGRGTAEALFCNEACAQRRENITVMNETFPPLRTKPTAERLNECGRTSAPAEGSRQKRFFFPLLQMARATSLLSFAFLFVVGGCGIVKCRFTKTTAFER